MQDISSNTNSDRQQAARKAIKEQQDKKKKDRITKMTQNMEEIQNASEGNSSQNSPEVKVQAYFEDQE